MKIKSIIIVAGVSVLHLVILAGLCFTGGCKSTEILSPKGYIPAPAEAPPSNEPDLTIDTTELPPPVVVEQPKTTKVTPIEEKITLEPVTTEALKYTVSRGDSFWLIAKKYGVSYQELAAYNNLSLKKTLKTGIVLNIPPGGKLKSTKELKSELKKARKVTHRSKFKRRITPRHIARQPIPTSGTYIVKAGDNPWTIARKFRVKNHDLLAANGLNRSSVLKIGQKLVIPHSSSTAPEHRNHIISTTTVSSPVPTTIEDADKTTNDILDGVDDPITRTKSKTVDTANTVKPTTKVPSKPVEETPIIGADTVTLDADTTIEKFAAAYKVKIEDLERLNPDLPKDGKLKAGLLILMPSK